MTISDTLITLNERRARLAPPLIELQVINGLQPYYKIGAFLSVKHFDGYRHRFPHRCKAYMMACLD
ncbi:MAG: hypothetical protein DBP02_21650 [gamma proteobacterium symbiont of Ctena orbiculata]|nr:MAG: hypothetical protein DBP02_21650 [gamma proteobacterium symbiont of Ctena orbiculata]PUB91754.1 MAG: hypothetical protein DBP01_00660 [gamma proteobacterium symbiont of Ctena orbiculata]